MSDQPIKPTVTPLTVVDSTLLFEKALHSWTAIDLSTLQKELDSKAIEIQNYQKESLLGRKELATQTKDFKKLQDEEKLENFNKLLKSYQNVIDSMTKKSKNVENLFFKIYSLIAEAPDPKPLLKVGLESILSVNQLDKLKNENLKLEEKILKFADYDKLKDQINQTEVQLKNLNEIQLKAKDDEWKSILEEKEENWLKNDTEKDNQIEILRKQIQEHEINEKMLKLKLDKKSKALGEDRDEEDEENKEKTGKVEDDEIKVIDLSVNNLQNDLENAKKRIKSLENRNEELRRDISLSNSNIEIQIENFKNENNKQIINLEGENSLLIAKLDHERKNCKNLRDEINSLKENFQSRINQYDLEIKSLRDFKLNTQDYDEVKKELELLKQIQFGDDIENDNEDEDDINFDSVSKIESAIIQRNKKLNNELIELRNKNDQNEKIINEISTKIKEYENEIVNLKDSNLRLENDLINFENNSSTNNNNSDKWETMSMISSIAGGNNNHSPTGSIINDNKSVILTHNNAPDNNSSSLLPIITQQRDRFRKRNKELEEENKKHFNKIIELKREINNLKNDNRELYEKIRFLQYHQTSESIKKDGGDIENKYKLDYEHDLHPIEQFRLMETKRISSTITPWDRIFIQLTRTVLSTPFTRWLFVAYCLSLHLLVMILTFIMMGHAATIEEVDVTSPLTGHTGGISGH